MDTITCPNCEATMNSGEACPECDHRDDDDTCQCAFCELESRDDRHHEEFEPVEMDEDVLPEWISEE